MQNYFAVYSLSLQTNESKYAANLCDNTKRLWEKTNCRKNTNTTYMKAYK